MDLSVILSFPTCGSGNTVQIEMYMVTGCMCVCMMGSVLVYM